MRFDRLVTLGLFDPLGRMGPAAGGGRLPVLMYHSVSDSPEAGTSPYYRVCTPPERFREHMRRLSEAGWTGVSLSDGLDILEGRRAIERRPFAITFDDGFRDFGTDAFPTLREFGFSATVYLPTAFIGTERKVFKERDCLDWDEVRKLCAAGIEFGSHTVSHPILHDMPWSEIERELSLSKEAIEGALGRPVRSFAYPYAFPQADTRFSRTLCDLLRQLGYQSGVTTVVGRVAKGDNPFSLKRLPANGSDDWPLLRAKVEGAYDWFSVPQSALKTVRQFVDPSRRRHAPREASTASIGS